MSALRQLCHQKRPQHPYFVNTGNYRTGKQLATLGKFYAKLIHDTLGEDFDAMFGPAYKGIPLVSAAGRHLGH